MTGGYKAELNSEILISYPEGISLIEADATHRLIRLYLFKRNLCPWYKFISKSEEK